nr:pentatricopeptide repeat-containing protein [Tanacetum cinerariifolium]
MVYLDTIFGMIGFNCLLKIKFGQILRIPIEGQCSFLDKWSLDNLGFSVPSRGLYQTTPPTPDEIKLYVQVEREEPLTRIRHSQTTDVNEKQVLTREITPIMKTWVEIICENVFCLGGNRDHVPPCLCHMLYCIATFKKNNLAFFVEKQMEIVTKQVRLILPYSMLLTRLFNHVMFDYPELSNGQYVLYDRVIFPLAPHYKRNMRKDYGTKRGHPSTFTSSSSDFDHPSSSHHIDDDNDENDKEQTDGEAMINSIQNGDHPLPVVAQVETAKDLWDASERQMRGSEYGEQDRKAAILYEYETFKATEGEQLLDTYLRYLQQNQGDVNDALGYKKKVVVTSDPLPLVAEKT